MDQTYIILYDQQGHIVSTFTSNIRDTLMLKYHITARMKATKAATCMFCDGVLIHYKVRGVWHKCSQARFSVSLLLQESE